MRILKAFLVLTLLFPVAIQAQEDNNMVSLRATPHVLGMQRPTGFVIGYEGVMNYKISSDSPEYLGSSSAEVINDRRVFTKIKVPIINTDNIKLAAGLYYFQEEFNFEDEEILEYPLYRGLEDKHLRSTAFSLNMILSSETNQFIMIRLKTELNGDYTSFKQMFNEKYLKFSFAAGLGWKKSACLSYGFGIGYSYTFGKPSLYPVVLYNHTYNKHWGVEVMAPLNAKVRYSFNDKNYLKGIVEFKGAGYNLNVADTAFQEYPDVELGWSEIRYLISYEREIHDWLWFGVSAGYRDNISFSVSEHLRKRNFIPFVPNEENELIKSDISGAMVLNARIFFVVPRKYYNK